MISADVIQEVKILNGTYPPSEARQLICSVIDNQINFYKLQHLSHWERNHKTGRDFLDQKVEELTNKRCELMEIIKQARLEGRQVTFGGCIELTIED